MLADSPVSQTCGWPSRQRAQRPQADSGTAVTRCPTCRPSTAEPTSTTSPLNSWPITWPGSTNEPCR